jgi:phosphatidylethanolamine-binding protein (PEBP) family uncharacterized protein
MKIISRLRTGKMDVQSPSVSKTRKRFRSRSKQKLMKKHALCAVAARASLSTVLAQQSDRPGQQAVQPATSHSFQLSSTTFADQAVLRLSMINNIPVNGVKACSIDGSPGGDQSPELSWTNAPRHTASFAVIAFDVTASFTHWGMYNIPATTTELPEGAGVAGSTFGLQVVNFFRRRRIPRPMPTTQHRLRSGRNNSNCRPRRILRRSAKRCFERCLRLEGPGMCWPAQASLAFTRPTNSAVPIAPLQSPCTLEVGRVHKHKAV